MFWVHIFCKHVDKERKESFKDYHYHLCIMYCSRLAYNGEIERKRERYIDMKSNLKTFSTKHVNGYDFMKFRRLVDSLFFF